MARHRLGAAYGIGSQSHAQPVDAGRQTGPVGFSSGLEITLVERQRFAPRGRQPRQFDPEPGIDIVELGREQPGDVRRLARGGGQFKPPMDHLTVDLPQREVEPPCAQSLAFERADHVAGQIGQHLIEQFAVAQRLDQPALDQGGHLRKHRQQRFGHPAEQLVEPHQRIGRGRADDPKPPRQGIARHAGQVLDPLEPQPAQHQQGRRIEPQGRDGELAQAVTRMAHRLLWPVMR